MTMDIRLKNIIVQHMQSARQQQSRRRRKKKGNITVAIRSMKYRANDPFAQKRTIGQKMICYYFNWCYHIVLPYAEVNGGKTSMPIKAELSDGLLAAFR